MQQFQVGQDGLMSELAASTQADWYASQWPGRADRLDFEAHIMLVRAFAALKTDTPFERRGGLTKARYSVLRMLYSAEDRRLPMTDIVTGMNVSPTNITKLVDGLEKDGSVKRAGYLRDKRKVWVELQPAGAKTVEATFPEVVRHVSSLWHGLSSAEKRVLIHLLTKLRIGILTGTAGEQVEWLRQQAPVTVNA